MPTTTVHLAWTPNPTSELVGSYEVWQQISVFNPTLLATVTVPEYDIVSPAPGAYKWWIKAINVAGTGPASAIASGPALPSTPSTPVVTVTVA